MTEIILEGVLIDESTGEVLGDMPGFDRAAWAASQLAEFKAQIKAYEQAAAIVQQVIFRYQEGKTATYGDRRVSIRSNTRHDQDLLQFREFIATAELTRDELQELALAAKGFDQSKVTGAVAHALADMTVESMTRPFVVIETVRKTAPQITRPDTLLRDLERSVEALS